MQRSAVVDTSVLVSAFLFPHSIPGHVLSLAKRGDYVLHLSPILLEEVQRSLRNPRLKKSYKYTDKDIRTWCNNLSTIGNNFLGPLPEIEPLCRDPDDNHVIAAAIAVGANYIVTGDKDLLVLSQYEAVQIITVKSFLAELL